MPITFKDYILNKFGLPVDSPISQPNPGQPGYIFNTNMERGAVRQFVMGSAIIGNAQIGTTQIGNANIGNISVSKLLSGTLGVPINVGTTVSGAFIQIDGTNNRILVNDGTNNRIVIGSV